MELKLIWQDYGLDHLEEGIAKLFPERNLNLEQLFAQVLEGDIFGAIKGLFQGSVADIGGQLGSMRNVFVWLLVLGIVSTLMTHFVEIFDRQQVADMAFYFLYLLCTTVLLKCFAQAADTAKSVMENTVLFAKLLIPAYLFSIGVSSGAVTAGASRQLLLLAVYGVESVLSALILPLIYSFSMLSIVNGIWIEEKLDFLIDLLGRIIGWGLKGALGIVTGLGIFQRLIAPVVDSARNSALQKLISAIPGVGSAVGGVTELVLGSAMVIRNSIGVVLLLLLILLCIMPLMKIAVTAILLKAAAAFMGIVSDRRVTACVDRIGNACMLLFRAAGTAMMLFLIAVAVTGLK